MTIRHHAANTAASATASLAHALPHTQTHAAQGFHASQLPVTVLRQNAHMTVLHGNGEQQCLRKTQQRSAATAMTMTATAK